MPSPLRTAAYLVVTLAACQGCRPSQTAADPGLSRTRDVAEDRDALRPRRPALRLGSDRLRHRVPGQALAFSPDGRTLFSGGADGAARAWDVATGELRRTFPGEGWSLRALALSPGGGA